MDIEQRLRDIYEESLSQGQSFPGQKRFSGSSVVDLSSPLTAFGEVLTGRLVPKFQYAFPYDYLFSEVWDNTVAGTGSVSAANRLATASTGATAGGTAVLETHKGLYYRSGLGGHGKFTTLFNSNNTSNTDGTAYMGLLTDEDGYAVGYQNGVFGFLHRNNSVDTFTPMSSWNLDTLDGTGSSGVTLDPTKGNIWMLQYQYLGFGIVVLWLANPNNGKFMPVYHNTWPNQNTATNLSNPSLCFRIEVDNGTSNLDVQASTASIMAAIEGESEGTGLQWTKDVIGAAVTAVEAPILSIRSKATFQTRTNRANVVLDRISAAAEATKAITVRVYKGGTPATGTSWADVNTNESVVEVDTASTTFSGGRHIATFSLGKDGNLSRDFSGKNISIEPGESVTITAVSASGTHAASADITWREEI